MIETIQNGECGEHALRTEMVFVATQGLSMLKTSLVTFALKMLICVQETGSDGRTFGPADRGLHGAAQLMHLPRILSSPSNVRKPEMKNCFWRWVWCLADLTEPLGSCIKPYYSDGNWAAIGMLL